MKTQVAANAGSLMGDKPEQRKSFAGRRVTVIGLARAGLASALLCRQHGAEVFVTDNKTIDALSDRVAILENRGIAFETGGHTRSGLDNCDVIVVSPGIPLDLPILGEARARAIPIISEIEAAYLLSDVSIVAVTGSNGKTTTTAWLGEIYRTAGMSVEVAGNIGRPYADAVMHNPSAERYVLEISSFQLETIESFAPSAAVILNISPDHLDRHGTLDQYVQAKLRLFANQTAAAIAVKNRDDPFLFGRELPGQGQVMEFSLAGPVKSGVWSDGHVLQYRCPAIEGELMSLEQVSLPGRHNLANAVAAACVALADGMSPQAVQHALRNFKGVEHRIEFVAELDGIRYVNDSKATNPDSVRVALEAMPASVVLIMGGQDKGTDFSVLFDRVKEKVRRLICTGKAAELIAGQLSGATGIMVIRDFQSALEAARKAAQSGDTVLLSPGCASFDNFNNYEERGQAFKDVVFAWQKKTA